MTCAELWQLELFQCMIRLETDDNHIALFDKAAFVVILQLEAAHLCRICCRLFVLFSFEIVRCRSSSVSICIFHPLMAFSLTSSEYVSGFVDDCALVWPVRMRRMESLKEEMSVMGRALEEGC